jgi:transcription termination/antitermination protein NusG
MSKQKTDGEKHWYAIHTYAGYENAVERNLKQRVESLGLEDRIFEILVPAKKVVKVKRGKRVEEEEKVFPGYVLVNMVVDDETWYMVRNTPRVTGFVGSGINAVPMTDQEVQEMFAAMKSAETEHEIDLEQGDNIVITDGPFKDLEGKVDVVNRDEGKVKVFVNMFGRETPVELDFLQLRKL